MSFLNLSMTKLSLLKFGTDLDLYPLFEAFKYFWNYFEGNLGDTSGVDWSNFEDNLGSLLRYAWDYFGGSLGSL